jgi:hypothetical protein
MPCGGIRAAETFRLTPPRWVSEKTGSEHSDYTTCHPRATEPLSPNQKYLAHLNIVHFIITTKAMKFPKIQKLYCSRWSNSGGLIITLFFMIMTLVLAILLIIEVAMWLFWCARYSWLGEPLDQFSWVGRAGRRSNTISMFPATRIGDGDHGMNLSHNGWLGSSVPFSVSSWVISRTFKWT